MPSSFGTVLAGSKNYSRIPKETEECRKLSDNASFVPYVAITKGNEGNASIVPYARIVPAGRRCKTRRVPNKPLTFAYILAILGVYPVDDINSNKRGQYV